MNEILRIKKLSFRELISISIDIATKLKNKLFLILLSAIPFQLFCLLKNIEMIKLISKIKSVMFNDKELLRQYLNEIPELTNASQHQSLIGIILPGIIYSFIYVIGIIAIVIFTNEILQNKEIGFMHGIKDACKKLLPVLITVFLSIICFFAIFSGFGLTVLLITKLITYKLPIILFALICFLFLDIFFIFFVSFSFYSVILNSKGIFRSMKQSFSLAFKNYWYLLKNFSLLSVFSMSLMLLVYLTLLLPGLIVFLISCFIITQVVWFFTVIFHTVIFTNLKTSEQQI